jgi:sterol desaturase/sphingolipid hydroxylase (fatty acid hydroxylase superfamily)
MYIDTTTRLVIAGAVFVFFALLETARPQRSLELGRKTRWTGNLGVFATDLLLIGLPLQGLAFAILIWSESHQFGLMNLFELPFVAQAVIGFLALDALFYFQHRLSHSLPVLWRLHRVHHADTEMDVSTANRIHPLESLWLTFLRVSLAILLGIPIIVIIAFQITLNIVSIFNHANLKIPVWLDSFIRWIIVTPNMHDDLPLKISSI